MTSDRIGIVIQARTGSTRLPKKVLMRIGGFTLLDWVIFRCRLNTRISRIIVATSTSSHDMDIVKLAMSARVDVFRGSEYNVLERYLLAAREFSCDAVVRISADCPFVDPDVIDQAVAGFMETGADYNAVAGYPEGLGAVEVLRTSALALALERLKGDDDLHREHVITYMLENPGEFDVRFYSGNNRSFPCSSRFSIDTLEDLERARRIADFFQPSRCFRTLDIVEWATMNNQNATMPFNI